MYHIHFTLKWHYVDHSWTTQISKVVNSTNWKIWQKFWKLSAWNMRTQGNSNILQWLMPPQKMVLGWRGGAQSFGRGRKNKLANIESKPRKFLKLCCVNHIFLPVVSIYGWFHMGCNRTIASAHSVANVFETPHASKSWKRHFWIFLDFGLYLCNQIFEGFSDFQCALFPI